MSALSRTGWQTILADLALILFLVTLRAHSPETPAADTSRADITAPMAPAAVFRPETGPTLETWLAQAVTDDRQTLIIMARHAPGERRQVLDEAGHLLAEADRTGVPVSLLVEPAQASDILAVVEYGERPVPQ